MAYRKITVSGTEYKYVIGRTHLKIHGRQAVLKEVAGVELAKDWVVLTPGMIADYIQGKPKRTAEQEFPPCTIWHKEHDEEYDPVIHDHTKFGYAPFDLEIYDKHRMVNWCKDCYAANADDI